MNDTHIFISHTSKDDEFVKDLRLALQGQGLNVWVDSRNLRGGAKLAPEIEQALEEARAVIVVFSQNTFDSDWVFDEVQKAIEIEERTGGSYRVIPVLMPDFKPSTLKRLALFKDERLGISIRAGIEGLSEALPAILAALGERLPDDRQSIKEPAARPVAELKLRLKNARLEEVGEGKQRIKALAQLIYDPADTTRPAPDSREFVFTTPLGPIEADDLRWYLENYYLWPTGVFTERAKRIEEKLPHWGHELYDAATAAQSARELLADWQLATEGIERRFSIFVDSRLPEGSGVDEQLAANEAASGLLALPWELMHDGRSFLFQGQNPVRVRRCLPKERAEKAIESSLPIRILLVSPRPEDESAAYIDHRISARPLVDAVESLGELAELTVLAPPTFQALQQALRKASDAGKRFDVIHFDGHGVYNRERGLGALCFEDPQDSEKMSKRASELIDAEKLAALIRDYRVPLVFLEACQSASEERPTASVAAKLLDEGVTSVVAMTHSVLVETARRFVTTFYRELAEGKRIGTAMLAGQHALFNDDFRFRVMGAGELRLQDWFVPVLYQEENDPRLITGPQPEQVQILYANKRRLSLGALPEPPAHSFIGRSRELLSLERLLRTQTTPELSYVVIRGQGGEGKTTLAVELTRWLVRTNCFRRAAFVSLEQYTDARSVLDHLGRQLSPEGEKYSVAHYPDLKEALQPIERALRDYPTLVVLDNIETVLPDASGQTPTAAAPFNEFVALFQSLLRAHPATRILFTSRESLPAPFNHKHREISLHALSREDAIELVSQVMKQEGREPKYDDAGNTEQEITDLVEAVDNHARALVLLAREVARLGVRATTDNLRQLMPELDKKNPGDRENSLYASVELSLRRLPPETREQIKALGVFHGGAHLFVLGQMLGVNTETVGGLARQLIEVGLAEPMAYGHLRLDPALPPYLLRVMSEAEQEEARLSWVEGMKQLTAFLYQQRSRDVELAAQLTLLELPNLMVMLLWLQGKATPEEVVDGANIVEALLSNLGRPQALAQATRVREQAAKGLSEWGHAQFQTERTNIDRLLERGDLQSALTAAQQLLQRCLAAGEEAYHGAAYDIAMAHLQIGRVLQMGGNAEAALLSLTEAQRRSRVLANAGDISAEGMVSATITESGDCLTALGRWDEAAAAYQESIRRDEHLDARRGVAVSKGQLGYVHLLQGRYDEALEIYNEARAIFESLGEPGSVATAWHQIGMVHKEARQFEQAEWAYRQSLAISVQQKDLAGEASSLNELGLLYDAMGQLEDAVKCLRQATDIAVQLKDQMKEGLRRSNLAIRLIKLHRYDEARRELLRAIECRKPYGHAAQLWKTLDILCDLEQATNNPQGAVQARRQAIESYLAYRRDGGQSMTGCAQLCEAAAQAIEQGDTTEMEQTLAQLSGADIPPSSKPMIFKLQAILRGDRNPVPADDPNLDYDDAVELQLLLEALGAR